MESTLADVKQLFNAKALATPGPVENMGDNEFGIVDYSTGNIVTPANFEALPEVFDLVARVNGKVYYGSSPITKSSIRHMALQEYQAPERNHWAATIENCKCTKLVQLFVGITEAADMTQNGLNWNNRDVIVEVAPEELECYCSCDGIHPVYENNVFTKILVEKVNISRNMYYEAFATVNLDEADGSGSSLPGDPDKHDTYNKTGGGAEGFYVYDGTAWVQLSDGDGKVTDLEAFVEAFKEVNTGDDEEAYGPKLVFNLLGSEYPANPVFADLEPNYIYPRGVILKPSLKVDDTAIQFEEIQPIVYELGSGYDMRAEEWDNMNYYTNLNFRPQEYDGLQNAKLRYQFDNNVNYNVITFEHTTDKVNFNSGRKRLFGITIGIPTTASAVLTGLKNAFGL